MKTVLETLQGGTEYLEKRSVPEARLNMQLMLAHQLGCSKLDLYLQFDRPLGEDELKPLRDMLRRRGAREPLQHILGEVEFSGHCFVCDHRALIPRPETEELVTYLLQETPPLEEGGHVADVGTGSGVIGLSLAAAWKDHGLRFSMIDAEDAALSLAQENAERLGLLENVSLKKSNLLQDAPGPYQLIVANLPYIATDEVPTLSPEVQHDPTSALDGGPDGLDLIRELIAQAAQQLTSGGRIVLELGADQAEATLKHFEEGPFDNLFKKTDLAGIERFVGATKTTA